MLKHILLFLSLAAIGTSFSQQFQAENSKEYSSAQPSAVFEENKGQMKDQFWNPRPDVLYYGTSEGMNYYIKNSGMSYQLSRVENWKDEEGPMQHFQDGAQDCKQVPDQIGTYRVDAEWLNSNPDFEVIQGKVLDGYNNYYNVPEGVEPALFVKKYETLTLKNVWEGIDLHYYGTNGFLETDYLVAPGADYQKIQIQFKGAELSTDDSGNLIIKTPFGEIQEGALKVYQNNERIEAYWNISEDNVVSFEIPNYNSDFALRIDPLTRVWGTYYGSAFDEWGFSLATDATGNVYLAGETASATVITSGGHQNAYGGNFDAFLVKFNMEGVRLWGTYYGGTGIDRGRSTTIDGFGNLYVAGNTGSSAGIASGGHQNTFMGSFTNAFLVKFNSSGVRQWGTYYGETSTVGCSAATDGNGNVFLAGYTQVATGIAAGGHQDTLGGGIDGFLVKFNSSGVRQWGTFYGGTGQDYGRSVATDGSGSVYLGGSTWSMTNIASGGHQNIFVGTTDAFLVKFDSLGVRQWATYYGTSANTTGLATVTDGNGNVYLSGQTSDILGIASVGYQNTFGGGLNDAFIVKFNSSGVREWGRYFGGEGSEYGESAALDGFDNIYMAGRTTSITGIALGGYQNTYGGGSFDAYLAKFNSSGISQWATYYGGMDEDEGWSTTTNGIGNVYLAGRTLSTNEIASGGHQNTYGGGSFDAFVVKFKQPKVNGFVWLDLNENCFMETTDTLMIAGLNLFIQPGNIITQSINGIWSIDSLSAGTYSVTIDTTNINWFSTCPITQTFTVTNPDEFTEGPNFGLISTNPCPDPDVSIYAPFLRRCFNNQIIYVQACNLFSLADLNSTYVDVELDSLITVTTASLPYTSIGNNIFRFQTGNIIPSQCVNFNISVTISCNAMLGQTLCMDATLYPVESCALDTIPSNPPSGGGGSTGGGSLDGLPEPCTLPWDQSSLSVDGWCQNDTIYFTITNTGELGGGDMECYSPLWVTVDGVVTYTDSIMIQGGQTITYSFPGDGTTWILNAAQHPLHPGNSNPNAHVEACGNLSNWTPDLVNDFPQDDADPVVDIYCGVVTGSYDPNDKTGYPNGVTDQYYIQPNQQLQYVIRFQNTGTDTAFTVVIRDTLDIDLNIFTVTPGVSSHNYEFRMYGPRILEWTFNNILLPDSTTNEPESNGFVTFHVEQVPDLAPGTEITNDADIYFDFNDPITTNTTMHRIYEGFVSVASLEEMSKEEAGILVYPNPNNGEFTIVLEDNSVGGNYSIFDQQGRVVKNGTLNGQKTTIDLELQSGMYYLMVGDGVVKVNIN